MVTYTFHLAKRKTTFLPNAHVNTLLATASPRLLTARMDQADSSCRSSSELTVHIAAQSHVDASVLQNWMMNQKMTISLMKMTYQSQKLLTLISRCRRFRHGQLRPALRSSKRWTTAGELSKASRLSTSAANT